MKRKPGLKVRHFWLAAIILGAMVSVVIGGTIYVGRAGRDEYVCLRFNSDRLGIDWHLDLNTGFYTYDARPLDQPVSSDVLGRWATSDGKRIAYLRPTRAVAPRYALYVKPAVDGWAALDNDENATLIDTSINLFGFEWSPDNTRMAYTYREANGQAMLTIATPDGKTRINQPIITPRSNDVLFHGWSSDGAYVAISTNEAFGRTISFWSVADLQPLSFPVYVVLPFVENVTWSPRGRWLAYLRSDAASRSRLVVATPGQAGRVNSQVELTVELPLLQNTRLLWSPDGRHLALRYLDARMYWQIAIYRVDGNQITRLTQDVTQGSRLLWPQGSAWSDDGQLLLYWQERMTRPGGRDLAAYRLDTHASEILISDVQLGTNDSDPLTLAESRGRIAVAWRGNDGYVAVDLMDIDGDNRTALVRGAREVNETHWSPDGETVLVRWTERRDLYTATRITWARADGSNVRVLEDTDAPIERLIWLRDGKSLVYTARQGDDTLTVEIVNLESNVRRRLAEGLRRVEGLSQDERAGEITFWWETARAEAGVDSYTLTGERTFRYRSLTGQVDNGLYFRSPKGDVAALLVGPPSSRTLQLASADGQWTRLLRSGVSYSTAPRWSPDGTRLAFNYGNVSGTAWQLEIYDAAGERTRIFDQFGTQTQSLAWTRCD